MLAAFLHQDPSRTSAAAAPPPPQSAANACHPETTPIETNSQWLPATIAGFLPFRWGAAPPAAVATIPPPPLSFRQVKISVTHLLPAPPVQSHPVSGRSEERRV